MKVNWKVRIKNKAFWIALIPAVLLLARQICALFGVELDFNNISEQLVGIVETVFVILAILGIVVDPTTDGISDSDLAMIYEHEEEHPEIFTMGAGEEVEE